MAFCRSCGQDIGTAAFCPHCGASQAATAQAGAPASGGPAAAAASPTAGIDENVAGLLCYLVLWITGLIFLLIDKRPFVRFHGAQAIAFNIVIVVAWAAFWAISGIITFVLAAIHLPLGFLLFLLAPVLGIAIFAAWVFLMYKAYQHEKFKLPIIGDMVERMIS